MSTVVPAKETINPAVSVMSTTMDPATPAQTQASKHVDVEERLYSLSAADIERQVKALRALRWDVTHQEIVDLIMATLQRPLTKAMKVAEGSAVPLVKAVIQHRQLPVEVNALVDIGSFVSVINPDIWRLLGSPPLVQSKYGLISASNTKMPT
ncbi:hypothetical protein H310_03165 [Aphanomyces invadans]|uniref:Peptidase A2 domain-containing protein n=1 Tax=Aphanomyces invadans TaxID=157072 RepID=A0A024ULP0_9STRA|nr:hypothetical protein H310_03165 [Aphanomyces invadans]ETW07095.1 hypothetical protein H310_03165 [Aphanomyces invadans]|eukprot:XP_008865170.1 hypothetical protein H310_03165 [Aphanomyces invadans]